MNIEKIIGFGGGCHWCTEAVFQHLQGVLMVEQGWILSDCCNSKNYSEGVLVHYNPNIIDLKTLIEIHLHTHSSTLLHSMRKKYLSAVYWFNKEQKLDAEKIIKQIQTQFEKKIITQVCQFLSFKHSPEIFKNYYLKNPEKPFCKRFIKPKLKILNTITSNYE